MSKLNEKHWSEFRQFFNPENFEKKKLIFSAEFSTKKSGGNRGGFALGELRQRNEGNFRKLGEEISLNFFCQIAVTLLRPSTLLRPVRLHFPVNALDRPVAM